MQNIKLSMQHEEGVKMSARQEGISALPRGLEKLSCANCGGHGMHDEDWDEFVRDKILLFMLRTLDSSVQMSGFSVRNCMAECCATSVYRLDLNVNSLTQKYQVAFDFKHCIIKISQYSQEDAL